MYTSQCRLSATNPKHDALSFIWCTKYQGQAVTTLQTCRTCKTLNARQLLLTECSNWSLLTCLQLNVAKTLPL